MDDLIQDSTINFLNPPESSSLPKVSETLGGGEKPPSKPSTEAGNPGSPEGPSNRELRLRTAKEAMKFVHEYGDGARRLTSRDGLFVEQLRPAVSRTISDTDYGRSQPGYRELRRLAGQQGEAVRMSIRRYGTDAEKFRLNPRFQEEIEKALQQAATTEDPKKLQGMAKFAIERFYKSSSRFREDRRTLRELRSGIGKNAEDNVRAARQLHAKIERELRQQRVPNSVVERYSENSSRLRRKAEDLISGLSLEEIRFLERSPEQFKKFREKVEEMLAIGTKPQNETEPQQDDIPTSPEASSPPSPQLHKVHKLQSK